MKTLALILAAAALASCTATIPATGPNPLDTPGAQPTAPEIRAGHMEKITGNPTHHLR
jgi:hypothetical protein